jgi:acetyl esterase/lipase
MAPTVRFDVAAPYDVEETDVAFARPEGQDLLARIYRPKGEPGSRLPGLVDVHGGAWTRGDHTTDGLPCRGLAACGMVVASLGFRQGPDHKHPAASADIAAGVRYLRAHAQRLGVDPARIGVMGSSSGGHLALFMAVRPGTPEHAGTPIVLPDGGLGATAGDDAVAWVLALYPVADPLARYRYVLGRQHEPVQPGGFNAANFITSHHGFFADEAAMAGASVTRILSAREHTALPPAWVAQPEFDDNVPASITEALVQAYQSAGGQLEHEHFPGARHGFINRPSPEAEKAVALMRDFVGRQLGRG